MKLATLPIIKDWVLSWLLLARNKAFVLASALVDIVFLYLFGLMTGPVFGNLTNHTIIIGTLVSQELRAAEGRARPAVIDLLFQEPAKQFTLQFIGLLIVLAIVVFVLYCIFQGINWWMATSVAKGKTMHWRDYLLKFAKINILWFVLFAIWYCVDAIFDMRRLIIEKALDQPAAGANIVLYVILGIVIYLAVISYPLLNIKKAFSKGMKKSTLLIPAFALVAVHFLVGNIIVKWLAQINTALMFVVGAALLLVLFAWTRVYISVIVENQNV